MLARFLERMAARRSPRFLSFVTAKDAYESFVADTHTSFDRMTSDHYARARQDPRLDKAESGFAEAIRLSREEDALADAAAASYQLGLVLHARGHLEQAERLIRESLNVTSTLANRKAEHLSGCHYHLGVMALKQGRLDEAVRQLGMSRRIDEAIADLSGMAMCDQALKSCEEAGASMTPGKGPFVSPPVGLRAEELRAKPADSPGQFDASVDPPPSISEENDYVEHSRREVIVLASFSVETNDTLMKQMDSLGPEFGRPVRVVRAAFGSPDATMRSLRPADPDEHVCATVLILERAGFKDPAFQQLASASIHAANEQPDFRLLVYVHDVTVEELRGLAGQHPLFSTLFDTTQISPMPSLGELRSALVPYVRTVERLRPAATWRAAQLWLTSTAGFLTRGLLLAAGAVALLGWPVRFLQPDLSWLDPHGPAFVALVCGMLAFPVQAPLLCLLVRGPRAIVLATRDNPQIVRWMVLGTAVLFGAAHLRDYLDGPISWLLLGVATGVTLDAIQRAGRQAQRRRIDLRALKADARDPGALSAVRLSLRKDGLNPFACPILPTFSSRAFISYSPSSSKGTVLADAVYRDLRQKGASPFLDRASIPTGANWRQELDHNLGEAEVVVCIVDGRSARSEWVAAELMGALEARRLTGAPHVVVLIDPSVEASPGGVLPVFREVISVLDSPPAQGRPQVLRLNRDTRAGVVWSLTPGRFVPAAVFTSVTGLPVLLVMSALAALSSPALLGGVGLGLLAILEKMADFPLTDQIAERGWLVPVTLLTAFWLGSNVRAAIRWGYERGSAHGGMGMAFPVASTIGLVFAFLLFLRQVSVYYIGWSAVMAAMGWMLVAMASRGEKDVLQ